MIFMNYALMCLVFGTTFLAIKVGIDAGAPPFFSAGLRFLLAGSILLTYMVIKRKAKLSLLFRKEMFLTGTALTFGTFATLYWAEQHISSGIAAILSATAPLMILGLQTAMARQRLSIHALAGCLIGTVGVVLLLLPGLTVNFSKLWVFGCISVLVGQVFYSAGTVYSRRVVKRFEDTSPIALNAAQMMYGGAMLLVLSLFAEPVDIGPMLAPKAVLSLLYLIFAGSMTGHTIFYWLIAKTNPVFPSTWLYVSPLIALCLGAVLYGEPISVLSVIGGITIIVGIVAVNLDSLKALMFKGRPQRSKTGETKAV
ncbi:MULTISPECIES: DMT family transporter [Paenibacillus]|uniref:Transporter n=1 Tax=Paenibacillus albilobatus TaxID=2716884 RepID=A0A920C888_9BACL|nr:MULTISPECIES: EamA family transporter [Paenibacillus]MDR9854708.1 EamA family transporter [Paenibacillus sp. VCA1]GIO29831.1 transporter [Paenibacillus albilobatus]